MTISVCRGNVCDECVTRRDMTKKRAFTLTMSNQSGTHIEVQFIAPPDNEPAFSRPDTD